MLKVWTSLSYLKSDRIYQSNLTKKFCFRKCDLSSIESIKEFVNQFKSQETKCDVLVNNAAVMKCRKMVTKEGIESQLGVNHMGHILLTHLLKPSLEKADTNGRYNSLQKYI